MIAKITRKVHDRLCKSTLDLKSQVEAPPPQLSVQASAELKSSRSEIASIQTESIDESPHQSPAEKKGL